MKKKTAPEAGPEAKNPLLRYLQRFERIETDIELPIQGQVRDPQDMFQFLKDLKSEQTPKVIGVYLDRNNLFLGHQVFLGASPETFETGALWHYYLMFMAKKFILLINHPNSKDPTPTDADKRLMDQLRTESITFSFKPEFEDFVIVARKSYYSMAFRQGTACHCGHQAYLPMD